MDIFTCGFPLFCFVAFAIFTGNHSFVCLLTQLQQAEHTKPTQRYPHLPIGFSLHKPAPASTQSPFSSSSSLSPPPPSLFSLFTFIVTFFSLFIHRRCCAWR